MLTNNIENYDFANNLHREELKIKGLKKYNSSVNYIDKADGIKQVIYSHFCRSLHSALNQNRKHPKHFHEYIGHWLLSNADLVIKDNETKKYLFNDYPIPKSSKIKYGESYYYE